MIGDLLSSDRGTDRDDKWAPRPSPVVAVNPDCEACNIASDLGLICGCGDDFAEGWFCSGPCRQRGEHVPRDERVCLHQPLERVL